MFDKLSAEEDAKQPEQLNTASRKLGCFPYFGK